MVKRTAIAAALLLGTLPAAHAHVSFVASNAYADTTYLATATVPHGCTDLAGTDYDTLRIEIEIPAGMTDVRPADAVFGPVTIETDTNGAVTRLIWTKTAAALAGDTHLYQVSFRGRLPNMPLATLAFATTQICAGNTMKSWAGVDAPVLRVLPKRTPGWNKYTAQADVNEATIKAFFGDAQIVWSNGMAYSANPVTAGLIANPLTGIPAGMDYWVKY